MPVYVFDDIELSCNVEIPEEEARVYIERGREIYTHELERIEAVIDGDYIDLHYVLKPRKFDRLRRITGYLVGTLERFNDGKRAEESDRVKHMRIISKEGMDEMPDEV